MADLLHAIKEKIGRSKYEKCIYKTGSEKIGGHYGW
jgi:hypothetical protein